MSTTTQTQMPSIAELLAKNTANAGLAKGETVIVLVKSVTDWKPTTKGNLPRKMVITDKGNFWVLASSIKNLPTSFTQPVQATAVLTVNGQYLNMNRLEFAGLETATVLSIRELPIGAALFATSAGVKLAV